MLYTLLKPIARTALGWYYRSVEAIGLERIPADGPLLLAGNHPNALMDALVICVLVPRNVRLLAKSTLFANPIIGAFLRAVGVIPLYRVRDVQHDEAATPDPSRNASSFAAVAHALGNGSAVAIFPEGTSHDEPQLAPLRTGLARMTLEARDAHGVSNITIIPVGLVFEQKEAPRTRVLLQVGDPIYLDRLSGADASVASLTDSVNQRLRAVTLNFDSDAEATRLLNLAHTLAVLLAPVRRIGAEEHSLADVVRLVRRIARAARATTANQVPDTIAKRVATFEHRFTDFRGFLESQRIALEDIGISLDSRAGWRFALREGLLVLVLGPPALWGRINHWLPLTLARRLALRNVHSRDQPAMRTVVLGLALVLTFYVAQTTVVTLLFGAWWAALYAITLIPSAHHDLRYGDRTARARTRMRTFFRFRRDSALHHTITQEAAWLQQEAGALEQATN